MDNLLKQVLITIIGFCSLLGARAQDIQKIGLANQYYEQGQLEKARAMLEHLSKKPKNVPQIHSRYLQVLNQLGEFDEGEIYI